MKENPKYDGKPKRSKPTKADKVEPLTVPKTIYDIINNKLASSGPLLGMMATSALTSSCAKTSGSHHLTIIP